jgi:hypothetical protein
MMLFFLNLKVVGVLANGCRQRGRDKGGRIEAAETRRCTGNEIKFIIYSEGGKHRSLFHTYCTDLKRKLQPIDGCAQR